MNVLEQLQAMGFQEEPYRFDTGGGTFDGYGGADTGGQEGVAGQSGSELLALQEAIAAGLGVGTGTPGSKGSNEAVAQAAQNATSGSLTASDIAALNAAGLGSATGFNINNPTQSVAEMQAAQNVASALPSLMSAVMPGFGAITSAAQTVGGLISGQTTIGQAVTNFGIGLVANQLGISPGTLSAALNGNAGQAVANTAMGLAGPAIGQAFGMPSGLANFALGATGLGQAANQSIASSVNDALGIAPGTGTTSTIASGINDALGIGQGGTGTAGGTTPGFDFTGGAMPNFGGVDTDSLAPTPAPEAASTTPNLTTLAALAALLGQEEDKPPAYQVAPWELSQRTPFGKLPYSA